MPDITMCEGGDCPLRFKCYRFTATPDEFRQSYFIGTPYNKLTMECKEMWLKEYKCEFKKE